MTFLSYAKDFRRVGDIFLDDPDRYWPVVQLLETLLRKSSELSPAEREYIAAYVSKLSNCQFCTGMHRAVAEALGSEISTLDDSETRAAHAQANDRLRPVLELAAKLTLHPYRLVQEDIDTVVQAGWSERTVEDVIGVAALFAMVTRLSDGFGLRGEREYFAETGKVLAERGYEPSLSAALNQRQPPRV